MTTTTSEKSGPQQSPVRPRVVSVRTASILVAVAGIVVIALLATLICLWRTADGDAATERARSELRREAGGIVAQVFSVDVQTWQTDRAKARTLVGGEFADRYATELTRPPSAGAAAITWTSDEVGIIDAGPDHGDVLIRATVRTRGDTGAGSFVEEKRSVTAGFDRVGQRWVLTGLAVLT
ncbi:hypothetical protein AAFP35_05510 [Gordonia sp. CPCC 206044]|uniref:hypothetical protein n=1 Tax=Gordonia sp. CPCC 206044 TaxID=3140793 RepID=UPI003AF342EF